jgi:ArsR family transcriptional regulator
MNQIALAPAAGATVAVHDQLAVLADGVRTRMLAVLEGQEATVSELCDVLQLPQSTVSRHLKTLSEAGWITSRRDGTSRLYELSPEDLPVVARRLWVVVRDAMAATPRARQDQQRLARVLALRPTASQDFFASTAGQWDRLREELFGAASLARPLAALLDERWVVGDLGCGTGQVSELLAPFVRRVISVDASREMLQAARARVRAWPAVEVRRGPLERLPIGDGELDLAVLVLVLHHVADPGAVLAEAARTLRPGGLVLIVDMLPHDREDYRQTMGHVWLGFDERQVARALAAAGFASLRWHVLPPDPRAKGPMLFVARAERIAGACRSTDPLEGAAPSAPEGAAE